MGNRMVYVTDGSLTLCTDLDTATGSEHDTVVAGGWCCEECLWAVHVSLCGALVALNLGCEFLEIDPSDFQDTARLYPDSLPLVISYARKFIHTYNKLNKEIFDATEGRLLNNPQTIKS